MAKQIFIALAILAVCMFGGGALVGFDIIPASAGVAIWGVGIVLAIVSFIRTKPKD